ncbi:MAG: sigma-70 family RNA polymerase sigma factor [Nitrospirota bacterium]|nr:sigma-70 family RNA polymerase sigma factor [Nitrospirota bacterium]MDH5699237.1 sigma-70 family RNA polymerase sigma factor [Nitrospirota bacterium]
MGETFEGQDESQLIARCQQHDHQAFGQLIDCYASTVLNVIARMIGNQTDAQDVTQETFVSAFRAIADFRADSRFSTWLHRIAVNKAKDYLRAQARRQEREGFQPIEEEGGNPILEVADERTPEHGASDKQMAYHLEQAIQKLSPLYREAFVLKHVEGMGYEEMAQILGVGKDVLKMRVYKARIKLSKELDWLKEDV